MKTALPPSTAATKAFTIVEVMISMVIAVTVIGMTMSTFLFGLKTMYKDNQRLATNSGLRTFMAQISKETLNASYFFLLSSYTKLDGSVDLDADPLIPPFIGSTHDADFDRFAAHGDCLVLVTKTSQFRTTDIRQIRIYYRLTTDKDSINGESELRYYETPDVAGPGLGWGEGTEALSNGHTDLTAELNLINLNANPRIAGSKLMALRSKGRAVQPPYETGYSAGDRYPIFSSESPNNSASSGFISINVEFINGHTQDTMLSSSSFNYTISPRR